MVFRSPFNDIEAAKEERGRNEIAGEYQILSERYKSLNDDFDETEDFAKIVRYSKWLNTSNWMLSR